MLHCHCVCSKLLVVTADHRWFPTFPTEKGAGEDPLLPVQLSPSAESETRTLLPRISQVTCWRHRLALQCLYIALTHENARKKDSKHVTRKEEEGCILCILEAKSVLEVLAQNTSEYHWFVCLFFLSGEHFLGLISRHTLSRCKTSSRRFPSVFTGLIPGATSTQTGHTTLKLDFVFPSKQNLHP